MPEIRVSFRLPYPLLLEAGEYLTPAEGGSIHLSRTSLDGLENDGEEIVASQVFQADDGADSESLERLRRQQRDKLLRRVNHLLRWYRATTGQATIIDLTRLQAGPFSFTLKETGASWGDPPTLETQPEPSAYLKTGDRAQTVRAVRVGLMSKADPDVATLNLLDAQYAMSLGRFREAVLLCWGAIDSTFVRKFETLVDAQLTDEWGEARKFLTSNDFGLRHKMTTGWRLLTGQSLFAEPDNFWQKLCSSYSKRNAIIHEGHIATEDDAKMAIDVAQKILKIVSAYPPPIQRG